jgi:alpha-1,6-mannosyltransferase
MKTGASLINPRGDRSATQTRPRPQQSVPPIPGFRPRAEDTYAHLLRGIAPARLVIFAGGVSLLIYATFVLAFPITRWWSHPHAANSKDAINDMGRITGYSPLAAVAFVAAILALFACQFLVLVAAGRIQQHTRKGMGKAAEVWLRRAILVLPLLFAAVMVWMQPVTTTDLYGYVARGYLFAQLHQNPMIQGATQLPGGLTVDRPASPYGPAWLLVTWLVSRVAGEDLLANMLLFKLIAFAAIGVALWLVDTLARALYPERRLRIYVLFGWSPLLIFESAGNGHNDIVMMVCVLAAFALMLRRRARSAFAFLVMGALIKYVSAVFIPLWLVYELRHRVRADRAARAGHVPPSTAHTTRRAVVRGWVRTASSSVRELDFHAAVRLIVPSALLGLALAALCYAPFWVGLQTFTGLGQQLRPGYYNSSIVGFLHGPLSLIAPAGSSGDALDKTLRLVFYALFFVYAYLQTQRLWFLGPKADIRHVLTAAAKITFAALVLITFWFQPWYVAWLLPLGALSNEAFVRRQSTILAVGVLLTYAAGNFLLVNDTGLGRSLFVQLFEILLAFGPLLLLRAGPDERGWSSVFRRYATLLGEGLIRRPIFWERVMLALIVVVAAVLRLVRLGNLFAEVSSGSSEVGILKQASSDLRLFLADPQGLHGPFVTIQGFLVTIFGRTALAALLPSAVIGSLTVVMIYLLTFEVFRRGYPAAKRPVALLAALLAATSSWHVSLSRSGMEVVLLPLLMCIAMYWLLLALRVTHQPSTLPARRAGGARKKRRGARRPEFAPIALSPLQTRRLERRRLLLYLGCGICTGLACDLAPGLWLVPLIVVALLAVGRWRKRAGLAVSRRGVTLLAAAALITGAPVLWHYLNPYIGFPAGSGLLARTSVLPGAGAGPLSLAFWQQIAANAGGVLHLLISQDYSAGYPASGGAPIIPTLLGPFFFIGLLITIYRWRKLESVVLLMLVALPLLASIAVGTSTGVIEAASVLPAMCILPALGIYEIARWLGHLPIVLDRVNGARVFSTPEQIGRVLLLVFLLISTIRTFYWYFQVTLPSAPPSQYLPTSIDPRIVYNTPAALRAETGAEQAAYNLIHQG